MTSSFKNAFFLKTDFLRCVFLKNLKTIMTYIFDMMYDHKIIKIKKSHPKVVQKRFFENCQKCMIGQKSTVILNFNKS